MSLKRLAHPKGCCAGAALIIVMILLLASCDVPFDPKEDFRNLVAVYGILSDRTDTVFVRVFRSYNPESFDPLEQTQEAPVHSAVVQISDGQSNVSLIETAVARPDTSRYKDSVTVYAVYPLKVLKGRIYNLTVQMPDGQQVRASTVTSTGGTIEVSNPGILFNPSLQSTGIHLRINLSPLARGFRVRFFMRFEANDNGQWAAYVREIPRAITNPGTTAEQWHYHDLTKSSGDFEESLESVTFQTDAYQHGLSAVLQEFQGKQIRRLQALFVLAQVDLHLYNYYSIANLFRDPFSTRVDQPDYSNIQDGVGVFGAMIHDSVTFTYPSNFLFSR